MSTFHALACLLFFALLSEQDLYLRVIQGIGPGGEQDLYLSEQDLYLSEQDLLS